MIQRVPLWFTKILSYWMSSRGDICRKLSGPDIQCRWIAVLFFFAIAMRRDWENGVKPFTKLELRWGL
jgi:hypothetical protein